jgi:DNA repair protein RadC
MKKEKSFYVYTLKRDPAPGMVRDCLPSAANPKAVADFFRSLGIEETEQECFVVMHLDTRNRIKGYYTASVGLLDQALVAPREAFRRAIIAGASRIIVAHNHPSGDVQPSGHDISLTRILKNAGDIVGIKILDHVIVGESKILSFSEQGLL